MIPHACVIVSERGIAKNAIAFNTANGKKRKNGYSVFNCPMSSLFFGVMASGIIRVNTW